jgi:hypothetical protein
VDKTTGQTGLVPFGHTRAIHAVLLLLLLRCAGTVAVAACYRCADTVAGAGRVSLVVVLSTDVCGVCLRGLSGCLLCLSAPATSLIGGLGWALPPVGAISEI